ncbi:MAG: PHP domain-containing protein [Desulfobacter sp.]|nr:PHP domain-containing protein [Desulfobacter sp.]WDP85153.1 MAG: PHP domain-containing protein [Desulfobacter sp.]
MKKTIFADLHNHTQASDGDFSSKELIQRVKQKGIKVVGITDHDTLEGLEKAVSQGDAAGVKVLPGVEISVRFNLDFFTGTLHVLAYFSPSRLRDKNFVKEFKGLLEKGRGDGLVRARIDKINGVFGPHGSIPTLFRDLAFEDISQYSKNASRRHFALALEKDLGIQDKAAVNQIIGNASPAYLPSGIDLAQVAQFLKSAPVVGVLAHPAAGSFPGEGHYKEVLPPVEIVQTLLPELLSAGIQGLEVFYPGHTKAHMALVLDWADKHRLLVTGGSDCHDAQERPVGICGISEPEFLRLKQAIERADKKYGGL